jgi:tRNA threonylcarbamoyladenosine biosynthesis protein TsaE
MKYLSKNEKETMKIATDFAKTIRGGEVILLSGNLGAGKTVFVKGLAKALGVKDTVKSPTFNLMKCYRLAVVSRQLSDVSEFCHMDAYRLNNLRDILDIGAEEYIGHKGAITIIEWAERAGGIENLPGKIIKIKISRGKKENERIIQYE